MGRDSRILIFQFLNGLVIVLNGQQGDHVIF